MFASVSVHCVLLSLPPGCHQSTPPPWLRRALKGKEAEGVKLAQRGEETYLVRQAKE